MVYSDFKHFWPVLILGLLFSCYEPSQFILPEESDNVSGPKFADKNSLTAFLGTGNVKIVYTLLNAADGRRWVHWIDYNDAELKPKKLKKPAGSQLHADSPLLSADGKWVTYFLIRGNTFQAYMQKLDENAEPILVAEQGADPHWWRDPTDSALYLIYSNEGEFIPSLAAKQGGKTFKQKVDLSGNGQLSGAPVEIADKPMAGGLSLDGNYLVTAWADGAYYNTVSKQMTIINPGLQTCNASVSPDPARPNWMLFLNFDGDQKMTGYTLGFVDQHEYIFAVDQTNTLHWYIKTPDNMIQWQDPEWTNKADYIATLGKVLGTNEQNPDWDGYIIKMSDKSIFKFNITENFTFNGVSTPFVWIGG